MAKVLIVDDDPDMAEGCRSVLEMKGHKVSYANNRDSGMKAIEEFDPDVLILDVMMDQPDDGIAMAQELRRNNFTKPIMMVTGLSKVTGMKYDKDDSMVPVDEFVEKPIRPDTLITKINALLEKGEC